MWEWERASGTVLADAVKYTVMMKKGTDFLRNNLQSGTDGNSAAFRTALLQWCCYSRNFGASPTVAAGSGTGADDDKQDASRSPHGRQGEGQRQTPKQERNSHKQHEQYRDTE